MDYDIVVGSVHINVYKARDDLKKRVEQMIAEGWRPEGAATHTQVTKNLSRFTQTMVKD